MSLVKREIHAYVLLFLTIMSCKTQEKAVWEEDFSGSSLNTAYWNFETGDGCPDLCGWGNDEPQLYTRSNHRVEKGQLHMVIKKQDSMYTSTRITTEDKFEFKYGRVVAKAKLPIGKGIWPAIWMLGSNHREVGWPLCGEIDILEYLGKEPGMVFNSVHTADSHGNTVNTRKTAIKNIEEGFHIYEANWTSEKIEFLVDGNLLYTYQPQEKNERTWPFDQPFYLILNSAIGGNFAGHDIDDSVLPQEFIVDYIRVYQN